MRAVSEREDYSMSKREIINISGNDDSWWCAITTDGDFEYGGTYKPSEAAQVFWDAVVKYIHSRTDTFDSVKKDLDNLIPGSA